MGNSGQAPIGRSSIETISPKPIEEQIDDLFEWLEIDQPQLMGDIQELKAQIKALMLEQRIDELEKVGGFNAATNVKKEKAQYIKDRLEELKAQRNKERGD